MGQHTETNSCAPARRPLTIDAEELRNLWLPAERREGASVKFMERECSLACRAEMRARQPGEKARAEVRFNALCTASAAVWREWGATVEAIRQRGGLLLIGGAA